MSLHLSFMAQGKVTQGRLCSALLLPPQGLGQVVLHRPSLCVGITGLRVVLEIKNPPANAGDSRDEGSVPVLGRSPGGKHGNPLQYSCPEPGGLQSIGLQRVGHD